jgi:hypothetical protein
VSGYPVVYRVDQPEGARKRLTVAFRPILAIPHILLVGGPGVGVSTGSDRTGVLGLVAAVAAFVNWFIIVFTGQANQGILSLQQYYLRWRARVLAYEALLRDEYPPFGDDDYPVTADFPAVIEGRNRWTVGFRIFLIIPQVIVLLFVLIAWVVTAIIGWFAVLFTGRYPDGLWRFGEGVMRWLLRVEAYMLLLHDEYPPFSLGHDEGNDPTATAA